MLSNLVGVPCGEALGLGGWAHTQFRRPVLQATALWGLQGRAR